MKVIWFTILFSLPTFSFAKQNDWQSLDYIEKAFIEIAFKREYRADVHQVDKWVQPIHYQFIYHRLKGPIAFIETLANTHLAHLKKITGHPITLSTSKQSTNFRIILTKDEYYQSSIHKFTQSNVKDIARKSNCMATFKRNARHEITAVTIIIPVDYAMSKGLLPACIVEETTQAMGLPNDSDWVSPSIANDASKLDLLTGLDYVFLKLLYQPQLKPGMNVNTAKPVIEKTLKRFKENNLIKNAAHSVNQEGLYPLLFK